jgi:iron complex transport system permease protein
MASMLPGAAILCLGYGRIDLGVSEVVSTLLGIIGVGPFPDQLHRSVVINVRLPRTLLAMLAGAGLSVSGATLQGCFRNPLVGPQTIGVLTGAGFGGSLMIFLALTTPWIIAGSFIAGLIATLFVIRLSRQAGQNSILLMVLSGVVVGALFAALTTILQYMADPERQLPQLVFWLMGSFSTTNMFKLTWASIPILLGMTILFAYSFRLNVLSCGEEEARALGIPVDRDRAILVCTVSIICASIVSVAGIVGWVGLVAPHIARMIVGPDHKQLLPASACIGAVFLLLVDTICRSLTAAELPVSAITAIIGAPVFVMLLRHSCARGWAND